MNRIRIPAIDSTQRGFVRTETERRIATGSRLLSIHAPAIPIQFNLRGRAAGQFTVDLRNGQCGIRYNPFVFSIDFNAHLSDTVTHEVAHYLTHLIFGRSVRPHGAEWQRIMRALGAVPRVRGDYSIDGIVVRSQARHLYRCQCSIHELTTTRHRRIEHGQQYICRRCHRPLCHVGREHKNG